MVADSISEFGLRGQIVLESRENPVIVTGHTRVAACRSLGWTEIPDVAKRSTYEVERRAIKNG